MANERGIFRLALATIFAAMPLTMAGIPAAGADPPRSASRCEALAALALPGLDISEAKAVPSAEPGTVVANRFSGATVQVRLPRHCRIEGVIDRRTGAGGTEYGLRIALALPDDWNGRLLYQGGGGFNGVLNEPLAAEASGDAALARGFAVIATDGGHARGDNSVGFLADQQAALDFAFNAVPTVTRIGREIVTSYYGRPPHHVYSAGCSTGGREGMLAAQRYPLLFDGVVAGAPAMNVWESQLSAWNAEVAFNRIAPTDPDGRRLARQAFSAGDQRLLRDAVADRCDALDGLADGLINNLPACRFDPSVLQCTGEKTASCLSAGQVTALRTAFGGPRASDGRAGAAGFPYDLGLLGEHAGNPASLLPSGVPTQFGPPPSPLALDVDREIERVRNHPIASLTDTSRWTDLGTFHRRGGKIIFYHGASDPWFSALDTIDYFGRLTATNPDFDGSRFYNVPSMAHCAGGGTEVFDLLTPLVEWVEKGVAPHAIIAATKSVPALTRPLCPWPQYARYDGKGDPRRASSFACRSD